MTLINYLERNENARKIFGKAEIEIIKKQLLGLNLTPSEKTRLSRDIRKKMDVIEEISKYKKEFPLKKAQEINFLIEEAKEIIKKEFGENLKEIILFGSYSQNKQNKLSDIDLAVVLKDYSGAEKKRARILGEVNKKIDVQIYENLPEKIKKEIKKQRKIIFKR